MNNNFIKQLKTLYDEELYTNVIKVCDLSLSVVEQNPEYLTISNKLLAVYYCADALYHTKQYIQAENLFRHCLQMRKSVIKQKNPNNKIDLSNEVPSEIDIKYKIYLCCMVLKQKSAAMEILQSIGNRQRTPKINMLLGNLFRDVGSEKNAAVCFKEVLEECPLALDAADNLLQLGLEGVQVNGLMVEMASEVPWINVWLKAQAQMHSRDFSSALNTYKSMDTHGQLIDNIYVLVNMAYCYAYLCEDKKAISILQRARRQHPHMTFGLDLLSTLLANSDNEEKIEILENIVPKFDMSLWKSEHWVVIGNYMYALKRYDKAAYFGQQACLMNRKNIEALLLKANTLMQLNKFQEVATHCTEALQICPYRYAIHKCLVDCYIKMNRLREADAMALNACKQLNYSAHALKLHASVLLKDPINSGKTVKKILEKAVTQDKTMSTNAVTMLVLYLEQEQQYEQACQLLLKQIELHPSSRMHQLLGECYINLQKDEEAFHHFNVALRLDPNNQRAMEGLNLIGPSPSLKRDSSYYTCVGEASYTSQGTNASDHDGDAESDTDNWPTNSDIANFD